jgi:hypothetical protein
VGEGEEMNLAARVGYHKGYEIYLDTIFQIIDLLLIDSMGTSPSPEAASC